MAKPEGEESLVVRRDMAYLFDQQDLPEEGWVYEPDDSGQGGLPTAPPVDWTNRASKQKMMHIRGGECDRFMIALHRLTTDTKLSGDTEETRIGRVEYRRLVGMHGGGGGTSDVAKQLDAWIKSGRKPNMRPIMMEKAILDSERVIQDEGAGADNSHAAQSPHKGNKWPAWLPNCSQEILTDDHAFLGHNFCWHAQAPFFLWHRPLMVEFERLLQDYDMLFPGEHYTSDAIGAHYFKWDTWDGNTLPSFIQHPTYTFKTSVFSADEHGGFRKGSTIPNPLYRWYAPMSTQQQLTDSFPEIGLTDETCTKRNPSYSDPSVPFKKYTWIVSEKDDITDTIRAAMTTSDWLAFCTVDHGGPNSMENSHNKFHNRTGGFLRYGPGKNEHERFENGMTGNMTSNQSIFDPIFWLHHSNIERLLISWQKVYAANLEDKSVEVSPDSVPDEWLMNVRLYPWTKPDLVKKGALSWNTRADAKKDGSAGPHTANDGTFGDWWDYTKLGYEYDNVLLPLVDARCRGMEIGVPEKVMLSAEIPPCSSSDFHLYLNDHKLGPTLSLTTGHGSTCAKCVSKVSMKVLFDVTGDLSPPDANNVKRMSHLKVVGSGGLFTDANGKLKHIKIYNLNLSEPQKQKGAYLKQKGQLVPHKTHSYRMIRPNRDLVVMALDTQSMKALAAVIPNEDISLNGTHHKLRVARDGERADIVIVLTPISAPGEHIHFTSTHRRANKIHPSLNTRFAMSPARVQDHSLWFYITPHALAISGEVEKFNEYIQNVLLCRELPPLRARGGGTSSSQLHTEHPTVPPAVEWTTDDVTEVETLLLDLDAMQYTEHGAMSRMGELIAGCLSDVCNPVLTGSHTERGEFWKPYRDGEKKLREFFNEWLHYLPLPQNPGNYIVLWDYLANTVPGLHLTNGNRKFKHWFVRFLNLRGRWIDSKHSMDTKKNAAVWKAYKGTKEHPFDINEYVVPDGGFKSFNEFFLRLIKPGRRPLSDQLKKNALALVSPCDGGVFCLSSDHQDGATYMLKAKSNDVFRLREAIPGFGSSFIGGPLLDILLWFTDYHHFHAPVSGKIIHTGMFEGSYNYDFDNFNSRDPYAPKLPGDSDRVGWYKKLCKHKRFVWVLKTKEVGLVAMIAIGFWGVGSITAVAKEGDVLEKGDYMGHFGYGGSSIILAFEPGMNWDFAVTGTNNTLQPVKDADHPTLVQAKQALGLATSGPMVFTPQQGVGTGPAKTSTWI